MAFTIANWTCISSSLNQGQETITPFGGSPTVENAPNIFMYGSPNDSVATISASNYFLAQYASLSVGDWILVSGTDATVILIVATVSSTSVTTTGFSAGGPVNTADIVDDAVTYAKLQDSVADNTLLGNPGGGAGAEFQEVTLGNGLSFNSTTLQVSLTNLRYATVNMTLAQFLAMYATPFQILASPGAGLMNIVHSCAINMHYGSAALVGGGAVGLQYGNTAHLAAPPASVTEAATDFTSASASTMFRFEGGLSTGAVVSTAAATAIYISNATAAFTVGTGATFTVDVWYSTVAAS